MSLLGTLFLGLALSLDSFAVSLSYGFGMDRASRFEHIRFIVVLGLFHFLMIIAGWFIGEHVSSWISAYDHWIAFGLLTFLGVKMIRSPLTTQAPGVTPCNYFTLKNTLLAGLALSIDAFISGFSLGLVTIAIVSASQSSNVLLAAGIIGLCASLLSGTGMLLGKKVSFHVGPRAEVLGGIVLIIIGTKVLLDHLLDWQQFVL